MSSSINPEILKLGFNSETSRETIHDLVWNKNDPVIQKQAKFNWYNEAMKTWHDQKCSLFAFGQTSLSTEKLIMNHAKKYDPKNANHLEKVFDTPNPCIMSNIAKAWEKFKSEYSNE